MAQVAAVQRELNPYIPPVLVRNATRADLPGIMDVENDWPERERAPQAKFESRLKRFAEGVFVAVADGRIVGVTTSCLLRYDPAHADRFTSWDDVTNNGWLVDRTEIENPNALYIVSTGIAKAYRRQGIFPRLIGAQIALSRRRRLRFCVTGAILTGYATHCAGNGQIDARTYALTLENGTYIDPLLRKLHRIGFVVPDPRHVVPEYFASEAAHDWSAVMVLDNLDG